MGAAVVVKATDEQPLPLVGGVYRVSEEESAALASYVASGSTTEMWLFDALAETITLLRELGVPEFLSAFVETLTARQRERLAAYCLYHQFEGRESTSRLTPILGQISVLTLRA